MYGSSIRVGVSLHARLVRTISVFFVGGCLSYRDVREDSCSVRSWPAF